MIDLLKKWFTGQNLEEQAPSLQESLMVLLIEIMMADQKQTLDERTTLDAILLQELKVDQSELNQLIETAKQTNREAQDLFAFTDVINQHYNTEQKQQLLVSLWRIALSDGELAAIEEHQIRKIAGLLHLHHSHFIHAKLTAKE